MATRRLTRSLLIILSIACIATYHASARVSWSWGAASQSNKALTSAGGTAVYSAEIDLNGADASLAVFSFDLTADKLVGTLKTMFGGSSFAFKGGTMAFGIIEEGDTVIRLLVLQLTAETQALVVKIEQSADDYAASIKPPDRHMIMEVPEFPGSIPEFYARNRDTNLQLASSSTRSIPAEVNRFYSDRLKAAGWESPLEDTSSLRVFMKGQAVCLVFASAPDKTGTGTITLLHKTHGVK